MQLRAHQPATWTTADASKRDWGSQSLTKSPTFKSQPERDGCNAVGRGSQRFQSYLVIYSPRASGNPSCGITQGCVHLDQETASNNRELCLFHHGGLRRNRRKNEDGGRIKEPPGKYVPGGREVGPQYNAAYV
ncbi:hypothetical protein KQX54_007222 [Cotesia glomerata]|uniref:Uncharacterized protein n=1 Tax=Cotesia glomerata TaxID=32391 RepID=A0AAV7I821_COTGL|nr:hypothetical protein KQX54_007222 [Cotesia glomerata]